MGSPRLLAPLGSPLRRLRDPRLNTRDVSFKIEAKQESKRCARNLKTICDAVRPEGCQTTYAKGHARNASPEETCAKDGPDLCTRERFVKHGKHSQEAQCSNLRCGHDPACTLQVPSEETYYNGFNSEVLSPKLSRTAPFMESSCQQHWSRPLTAGSMSVTHF
jgi:hypothetical protein